MDRRAINLIVVFVLVGGACGGSSESTEAESSASTPVTEVRATEVPTTEAPVTEAPETDAASTTTNAPETTTTEPPAAATEPDVILDQNDFGASHALSGAVVEHEGIFHIFYALGETNFGDVRVARATSPDAATWTMAEDRLLSAEDLPYSDKFIFPGGAAVLADGTWVMYFHNSSTGSTRDSVIGIATAPAPEGPWTILPEPIVVPGEDDSWDRRGVGYPHVLNVADGYMMWYDGHAGDQTSTRDRAIGVALSEDGLTWTKAGTEPVLTAGDLGDWDELRVLDPNVVASEDGYVMSYSTTMNVGARSNTGYGLAHSDDGMTWTKSDDGAYLWLIIDGEFLVPALVASMASTMIDGPDGYRMFFDLLFPGYGQTYAVSPPV